MTLRAHLRTGAGSGAAAFAGAVVIVRSVTAYPPNGVDRLRSAPMTTVYRLGRALLGAEANPRRRVVDNPKTHPELVFIPTPINRLAVGDHVYDNLAGVRQVKAIRDEVDRFYVTYHEGGFGSWHHVGETVPRGVRH